jgi:NAD(P)H-dependent FMN reductase
VQAVDQSITIAVISGTSRQRRESIKAARFIYILGQALPGVQLVFVDPQDFQLEGDGNDPEGRDLHFTDITSRADAFFIVTPEYNHSFPGSLKRLLDSEYENYFRKPVALAGASNGAWGGTRAVEGLLPALRTMGLVAMQFTTYFPRIQDIFDEAGAMRPEYLPRYTKQVQYAWEELLWFARALKVARDND